MFGLFTKTEELILDGFYSSEDASEYAQTELNLLSGDYIIKKMTKMNCCCRCGATGKDVQLRWMKFYGKKLLCKSCRKDVKIQRMPEKINNYYPATTLSKELYRKIDGSN